MSTSSSGQPTHAGSFGYFRPTRTVASGSSRPSGPWRAMFDSVRAQPLTVALLTSLLDPQRPRARALSGASGCAAGGWPPSIRFTRVAAARLRALTVPSRASQGTNSAPAARPRRGKSGPCSVVFMASLAVSRGVPSRFRHPPATRAVKPVVGRRSRSGRQDLACNAATLCARRHVRAT